MADEPRIYPSHEVMTVRIHADIRPDLDILLDWCKENNSSFNSVINSFLPAIAYVVSSQVDIEEETGKRHIFANLGHIILRELHERRNVCLPNQLA